MNPQTTHRNDEEEGRLPDCLRDPKGMLQRRWIIMLAFFVVVLAAGVSYVHLRIKPEYIAVASVLLSSQGVESQFVNSPVRDGAFEKISAMVGETLSTDSLAALIEEHGLYTHLRQTMSLPEVAAVMRRRVRIEPDESVGPRPFYETARVFTVSFRHSSPDVAAAVANAVAQSLATSGVRMRQERLQVTTSILEERMAEAKEQLAADEAELSAYREANWGALAADKTQVQTQVAKLRSELSHQLSRYTAEHPENKVLRHEISILADRLEKMHVARKRVHDLEKSSDLTQKRLLAVEDKVEEVRLATRLEEASERSVASVLDEARTPRAPTRTPGKYLLASLLAALGGAAVIGVLRELMDPVVIGVEQIEHSFNLPVLGGVTRIR